MLPGFWARRLVVLVLGTATLGFLAAPPPPAQAAPAEAATTSTSSSTSSTSSTKTASTTSSGTADRLRQLADHLRDAGVPGVVVARRDGDRLTRVARGVANLRTGRAARPDDRYRIGSNTKTMTSVVVLQLVAEGRLSLDDKVVRHLPGLGLDPRMTVRHVLQQTSGLHTDTMVFTPPRTVESVRFEYFTPRELVRLALTNPEPRQAPGTHWEYSNTNYVIAGMLIEAVTHHPAQVELARRIFRPLGLHDTYFPVASPFVRGRHLNGYLPAGEGEPPVDLTVYGMSWVRTAGAVVSTTRDETTFLHALFTGRLLPRAQLAQMTDTGEFGYGLGFPVRVPCVPGGVAWGHDGAVFGYSSGVFSTPDGSRQAAVGANTWLLTDAGELNPLPAQAAAAALCDGSPSPAEVAPPWRATPVAAAAAPVR
ncbi:D-alanyl-D-alanine carboxypeptidase [Actinopolymorpha cephalotaxi]|uniref:D-alanyl-D-alanine carboxypeptidase n=1 Tax=Actinopolymorpha cephalotaxi TaxID=504797 RepID=A0A1I3B3Q9_9ACTN|nr:serine hydrolase domain-containing protein [Actinopolymorpha cephalotaxi]NYH81227.1 D-alanyl-D-alanine carboxypeptidase [Actinopolymorpha cephalotaxi]SFH56923.1 D-alanyl-D-alanine carboxypeptidase [Actinopolymorpha cephalotaxi]